LKRHKKSIFWDDIVVDHTGLDNIPQPIKDYAANIMDTIAKHPEGLTRPQIKRLCTGRSHEHAEALKALLEAGKITKTGEGVKCRPFIYTLKPNE